MINLQKKNVILLISVLILAVIAAGCNGNPNDSAENMNINVELKDANDADMPLTLISLEDETGNVHEEITSKQGIATFSGVNLKENSTYTIDANNFENASVDFGAEDELTVPFTLDSNLILFDDFSDENSGWVSSYEDEDFKIDYVDGKYEVEHKNYSVSRAIEPPVSETGLTNYISSVDVKLVDGGGTYGFKIIWNNNNDILDIIIANDESLNKLAVIYNDNLEKEEDIDEYITDNEVNELKLIQNNTDLEIYLDGDLIMEYNLSELPANDSIIAIGTGSTGSAQKPIVHFDNFKLVDREI